MLNEEEDELTWEAGSRILTAAGSKCTLKKKINLLRKLAPEF
jgi:hypothetical protein